MHDSDDDSLDALLWPGWDAELAKILRERACYHRWALTEFRGSTVAYQCLNCDAIARIEKPTC